MNKYKSAITAIDFMCYMILYLAKHGNPILYFEIPYDELQQFAYDLEFATEEEKEIAKSTIKIELENGSYLEKYNKSYTSFEEALRYFFSEQDPPQLNSFWFGSTVLETIKNLKGE